MLHIWQLKHARSWEIPTYSHLFNVRTAVVLRLAAQVKPPAKRHLNNTPDLVGTAREVHCVWIKWFYTCFPIMPILRKGSWSICARFRSLANIGTTKCGVYGLSWGRTRFYGGAFSPTASCRKEPYQSILPFSEIRYQSHQMRIRMLREWLPKSKPLSMSSLPGMVSVSLCTINSDELISRLVCAGIWMFKSF